MRAATDVLPRADRCTTNPPAACDLRANSHCRYWPIFAPPSAIPDRVPDEPSSQRILSLRASISSLERRATLCQTMRADAIREDGRELRMIFSTTAVSRARSRSTNKVAKTRSPTSNPTRLPKLVSHLLESRKLSLQRPFRHQRKQAQTIARNAGTSYVQKGVTFSYGF